MPESLPPLRCEIRRPSPEFAWLRFALLAVVAATMVDVVAISAAREAQRSRTRAHDAPARALGRYHMVLEAPMVEVRCTPAPRPTRVNDVLLLRAAP